MTTTSLQCSVDLHLDSRSVVCQFWPYIIRSTSCLLSRVQLSSCLTCETLFLRSRATASMVPKRGSKPGSICLNRSALGPLGNWPELASYFPVSIPSPSGEYAIKPMPRALQTSWISRCCGPMLMSENCTCTPLSPSSHGGAGVSSARPSATTYNACKVFRAAHLPHLRQCNTALVPYMISTGCTHIPQERLKPDYHMAKSEVNLC